MIIEDRHLVLLARNSISQVPSPHRRKYSDMKACIDSKSLNFIELEPPAGNHDNTRAFDKHHQTTISAYHRSR